MDEFKPQNLANTAWAFATAKQLDAHLFSALARMAERRVGEFKPQNLTNTAWSFATVGLPDAQLFTEFLKARKRSFRSWCRRGPKSA